MENTFVFIGAGNMGGALVEAVCRAVEPKNVAIYDRDAAKLAALAEKTGCTAATDELRNRERLLVALGNRLYRRFARPGILDPRCNLAPVEPPLPADAEARNRFVLDHAVDGFFGDIQQTGYIFNTQVHVVQICPNLY